MAAMAVHVVVSVAVATVVRVAVATVVVVSVQGAGGRGRCDRSGNRHSTRSRACSHVSRSQGA